MFLTPKRPKNQKISDPVLRKKMNQLAKLYPRNHVWRHMHKSANQVDKEYKQKINAAKKIQKFVRFMRRMNQARQISPEKRTSNNPLWKNFTEFQMMTRPKPNTTPKLPKLKRNFGEWTFNKNNRVWVNSKGNRYYYPNINVIKINKNYIANARKRYGLPF